MNLSPKQIELVKAAVGEMREKQSLAIAAKDTEQNLKSLLDNAGQAKTI